MADRAQLSEGSSGLGMSFDIAEPHFLTHLNSLNRQLAVSEYLFGCAPTIADFSTYHLVWFVHQRATLRHYFESFPHLMAWFERIKGFGHGEFEVISGAAALEQARDAVPGEMEDGAFLEQIEAGTVVSVMPIDYGFQPVTGELVAAGMDEIAVARTDDEAGRVVVHFPRMGFQIVR
jgi:glutathione S-transferase